ncbi:MAG: NAD(P)H-dependent glycerol-3-phosphate dehydrogenase [bacterium]
MNAAVLGGGSWGTALATHLASKGDDTLLWVRDDAAAERLRADGENERYLPGVTLPASLTVTSDLADLGGRPLILAVPTRAQREVARRAAELKPAHALCAAKGYEPGTRARMSEVLAAEFGAATGVAFLAGPSHAEEVARGIPTSVVVASDRDETALLFQELLHSTTLRVYTNPDVLGAETAAALKNVIAIGAGIADGLGFGDNTKGALITRGLAEIVRLGAELGARPETFFGLAGIGDLVTTCASRHSRNRGLGELLGKGRTLEEAIEITRMVAEGVETTRSALMIAAEHGVELPITEQVAAVLFGGTPPREALEALMARDAKPEVS